MSVCVVMAGAAMLAAAADTSSDDEPVLAAPAAPRAPVAVFGGQLRKPLNTKLARLGQRVKVSVAFPFVSSL